MTRHRGSARAVALAALVVLLASCDPGWPTLGADPARTGHNRDERTVGVDDVDQLRQIWSAELPDGPTGPSPVVAGGSVFVVSAGRLLVFSADGTTGCSGTPKECEPRWTAAQGGTVAPAVADGVVYTAAGGTLFAFDARGATGCGGSPKVCAPLWRAPIGGTVGSPAVEGGRVFVGSDRTAPQTDRLYAFDAAGVTGCAGSPKVCTPLWRSAGAAGRTAAVAGGVVYAAVRVGDELTLSAFDASGSTGCSGTPRTCQPRWTFLRTSPCSDRCDQVQPPSVAGGRVYLLDHTCCDFATARTTLVAVDLTGQEVDQVQVNQADLAFARPPVAVAGGRVFVGDIELVALSTTGLDVRWRAAGNLSNPSVANGVVYVLGGTVTAPGSGRARALAFDAAGRRGCSGTPVVCRPLWTGGGAPGDLGARFFEEWAPPVIAGGTVFVRLNRLRAFRVPGT